MKKILAGCMAAAMAASLLVGCGTEPAQSASTAASEPALKTAEAGSEAATGEGSTLATDIAAELNIWASGEELQRFVEGFNKIYPNIKINITVVPNEEFLSKLTPVISSGQNVPDIFTGESAYVRYLINAGVWDDLSKDPYNCTSQLDGVWDYVKDVGTDDSGAVRALSWQTTPGSVIYRRDLAQEVLGVSEPADVEKLLTSYDAMLEVAAKFKEKGITMFGSWEDIMLMVLSDREQPWVVDGKLVIDPKMDEFLDMVKTITENGYDLNVSEWDPEWIAGIEGNNVFSYVLPTWGYSFVVKANAVQSKGQWAMCNGPSPYINGGTWLGIFKDSKNKEAAWAFLQYVTLNSEALQEYAGAYDEYVAAKSADEALAKEAGDENLAGQNQYEFYNQVMAQNPHVTITEYDGQINTAYKTAARAYATGKLTKEEAIQQFKSDVASDYPELTID